VQSLFLKEPCCGGKTNKLIIKINHKCEVEKRCLDIPNGPILNGKKEKTGRRQSNGLYKIGREITFAALEAEQTRTTTANSAT
jgi:hypothetical protein